MRNREEVVATLREAGLEVPRQGKDYITALDPETGDRWRLKGELYAHDFQRERLDRTVAETAGDRTPGDRGIDHERARAARRQLAARREQRAALPSSAITAVATGRMRVLLLKAWLRPLVVGLSLWLGICGGSWATMHWLSTRIQARIRAVRAGAAAAGRAGRDLAAAGRSLGAARRAAQRASDALGPGLQDTRRDVARALDLMRQRGRERDHGPRR